MKARVTGELRGMVLTSHMGDPVTRRGGCLAPGLRGMGATCSFLHGSRFINDPGGAAREAEIDGRSRIENARDDATGRAADRLAGVV